VSFHNLKTFQISIPLCCLAAAVLFLCQSCPARAFVSTVLTTDYDPDQSTKSKSSRSIVLPPEKSSPVRIPRFDQRPVIDGKLDDEVWKQAVKLKDFYQTTPGDNIAPSQPTEVFLGYDSKFLYVDRRVTAAVHRQDLEGRSRSLALHGICPAAAEPVRSTFHQAGSASTRQDTGRLHHRARG